MRRAGVLVAALALAAGGIVQAQNADSIVGRSARVYAGLRSFSADFAQVIDDPMVGVLKSRGHLIQTGQSRLSMQFSDPDGEAVVLDGTYAWIYTPSTTPGQVLRFDLARSALGLNPVALLLDRPAERYRAEWVRQDTLAGAPVDVVRLTPTIANLPFTEATVWLDRRDALPRRVEVKEPNRSGTRTITLTNVKTNVIVSSKTFTFTPPAGVRVVEQ